MIDAIHRLTRFKLKRQHSIDPVDSPSPAPAHRGSPASNTPTAGSTPPHNPNDPPVILPSMAYDEGLGKILEDAMIGSPLKKQRGSVSGAEEESLRAKFGLGMTGPQGDVLGRIKQEEGAGQDNVGPVSQDRPLFGESLGSIAQEKVVFGAQLGSATADQAAKTEDMEEEEL